MQKSTSTTNRYVPHLIAIGIFIIISTIFCLPAFQGNTLSQHDTTQWKYMSKESRDNYDAIGENPLWTNSMFSGMPNAALDSYSKNSWYRKVNHAMQFYNHGESHNPAIFFILAMLSFYLLMAVLRVNHWLSIAGSIAFAFSTYNPIIISAGHVTKMIDIGYMPAIFAGMIVAYRGKYLYGAAITAFALTVFFDAGHYQIMYYCIFLISAMVIAMLVDLYKQGKFRQWLIASLCLLGASIIAFAANSTFILTAQEYAKYSMRGGNELKEEQGEGKKGLDKEYAFRWSNGVGESLTLLVPNLYGGASGENIGDNSAYGEKLRSIGVAPHNVSSMTQNAPLYWGPQPGVSGPVYFGAVICFLFVLGMLIIRSKHKWWIAGISLFFIMLAMGDNFKALNYFMFDYFPLYNKFRAPTMALAIPSLLFPFVAIWALKEIFEGKVTKEALFKQLKLALYIVGGLGIFILILTQAYFEYRGVGDSAIEQQFGEHGATLLQALREDRNTAAMKDTLRSLLFIGIAAGILWAFVKNKINASTTMFAILAAIVIDLIPVAKRYLNESNFISDEQYANLFRPRPVDMQIMQDKDPYYRVLDLSVNTFNDAFPALFHKSIGGYSPAKLAIYQDMIDYHIGNLNSAVLNMLNTKYIITRSSGNQANAIPNPEALGNAWFVENVQWEKTALDEITALNAASLSNPTEATKGNFNPEATAILRSIYQDELKNYTFGKDENANIKLTKYGVKELLFESSNAQNGLAVFSDVYYPIGWKAFIDGKEVPIIRANYILRAIKIPAGQHQIKFTFESTAYNTGERITLVGSILITLLLGFAGYRYFISSRKDKNRLTENL